MIDLFTPTEAVTMENFNKRLTAIREALPELDLKIATGSYVGTGFGGAEYPNTLSFNFAPWMLIVQSDHTTDNSEMRIIQGCAFANSRLSSVGSGQTWGQRNNVTFSDNGKTICWYGNGFSNAVDNINGQMNGNDTNYHYFAIGI